MRAQSGKTGKGRGGSNSGEREKQKPGKYSTKTGMYKKTTSTARQLAKKKKK